MDQKLPSPRRSADPGSEDKTPFDLWLDRGLHRMFDEVAEEPIPEELLKLIETDRKR